jgi:predicted 3-demethylubiquinone-9 3-methyltransferase (glyoxalase superfamily)
VPCDTQEEIDYLWGKLSADAKAEQCGWLKDKYGLSWQITPSVRRDLLRGNDKQRIDRVTQAFLKMKKLPRSSGRPRVDRLPKSFRIPDC